MINGQTVLAVVPARGGSKRVPRKNLRRYKGSTLIEWAVIAAKDSPYIDRIIISTEDAEIKAFASQIGFSFVIDRPADLATDTATSEDVMRHALSIFPAHWVVLLQPTSPLRTTEDIDACIERAQMGYGCISVCHGVTNGAVYVATAEWLATHDFSCLGLMKYVMPEERSLDINTEEDFLVPSISGYDFLDTSVNGQAWSKYMEKNFQK